MECQYQWRPVHRWPARLVSPQSGSAGWESSECGASQSNDSVKGKAGCRFERHIALIDISSGDGLGGKKDVITTIHRPRRLLSPGIFFGGRQQAGISGCTCNFDMLTCSHRSRRLPARCLILPQCEGNCVTTITRVSMACCVFIGDIMCDEDDACLPSSKAVVTSVGITNSCCGVRACCIWKKDARSPHTDVSLIGS